MERGEDLKVEIRRLCDEVSFFKQEVHTSKIYLNLSSKNCTTNYVYFHVHLLYVYLLVLQTSKHTENMVAQEQKSYTLFIA